LLGSRVTWNGQPFNIGPAGSSDVVSAVGQTIPLPAGGDSQLMFLATGVNGSQPGLGLTGHYTDPTSTTFTHNVSDLGSPQSFPGESIALTMNYRDNQNGAIDLTLPHFYVYGYTLGLNGAKTVASITLPNDPNLEVVAMDLVKSGQQAIASSRLGRSGDL